MTGCVGCGALDGPLCPPCAAAARDDVISLASDYELLTRIVGNRSGGNDAKVFTGQPESMPPINLGIDALRTTIVWTAALWEDILRDADGISPRPEAHVRERFSLLRSVAIIAPRVRLLAGLGAAGQYVSGVTISKTGAQGLAHLRRLHDTAVEVTGRALRVVRLPGECPRCARRDLRRDDGQDTVYCHGCDWRTTQADYQAYVTLTVATIPPVTTQSPGALGGT